MDNILLMKQIYVAYYQRLTFFAYKLLRRRDIAEDVVSQVFTELWIHPERLGISGNGLAFYLYTSVSSRCKNEIKLQRRVTLGNEEEYDEEDVQENMIEAELINIVRNQVDKMPPQFKNVALLSLQGLKSKEISSQLDISVKTVRNIKGLVINDLQKYFKKYYKLKVKQ